ncbi:MAG: hypothetical protein M0Z79_10835 [Nitrospiraceae bacterium]|nr:hypothetical protein [Nitrospiraceae bacterium]
MSRTTFIDLKTNELSVYAGQNGKMERVLTTPVGERLSFSADGIPADAEPVLSLPLALLDARIIELPFSDINKIRELLPFELDGLVLGGSEGIVFDARLMGESNGKSRVLVAYIRKEILKDILWRLKASGLDPRIITSVELVHIVKSASGEKGLADSLIAPPLLSEEERLAAAARETKDPTFNFRRGEFVYTADTEKAKKSLKATAFLAALLLAVIIADAGLMIAFAKRDIRSMKDELRRSYQALFPEEKKIANELYQLKAHIKELKDKQLSFVGSSPLQLLLDLSKTNRPGVVLSEITAERDLILLKGEGPSVDDAQRLKTDLDTVLTGVSLSETKPSGQGKILFTIIAKGRKQ